MEPPYKRRRLSRSSYPEIDLHARRAQNDFRLKSIFESIFDKYGKDFDGIGDEINLETGEIVVNNGHILGMTNERDAGDAECSSEELEYSEDEEEHSSIEHDDEVLAVLGASKAGDAAGMEESIASDQSDSGADSLMGDVPAESQLHQLGKKSRKSVTIPSDDEADELASSDMEWASHSKDRLGAKERWGLMKVKSAFADEPAIESAWRAPPLPNVALLKSGRENVGLNSVDQLREYSDDEQAGISLWTAEVKKRPRRRRGSRNATIQRSLSLARGQDHADGLLSEGTNLKPAAQRMIKWTQEEEELLIYLKTATNLSVAAMEPYFPERKGTTIGSHWTYMIIHGKASPKPQAPTRMGRRIALSSLSPSIKPRISDRTRPETHDHDPLSRSKNTQSVQQQISKGYLENGSLTRCSGKSIEYLGDHHMNNQYQVGADHEIPNGYSLDESVLSSDDVGAHTGYTTGEPFSSVTDCEIKQVSTVVESLDDASEPSSKKSDHCRPIGKVNNRSDQRSIHRDQEALRRTKYSDAPRTSAIQLFDTTRHVHDIHKGAESAYQANSKKSHADTDQSYRMLKPLDIEDDVVMNAASTLPDQAFDIVFENGGGPWVSSPSTPVKAEPDFEGARLSRDATISTEIPPRCTTAIEASSLPKRFRTNPSALQQEEPILTAGDIIHKGRSTAEAPQKIESTNTVPTSSAQAPDQAKSSASHEPSAEVTSITFVNRQIVQVVIPFAPTSNVIRKRGDTIQIPLSHLDDRLPLGTTETDDLAFIRELSANMESAPAGLSPGLPHQENLAMCTPTRSPSVAAAESQYAASAAFGLNDVRSSLGTEIADSQPLSITPVVATPAPEFGEEASRPIILDADESQYLRMTPGVAAPALRQPNKATKTVVLDPDPQPLCMTSGIATPARKPIEEATESDIVESGSHPPSKTLAAARSLLKKVKKEKISDPSSSVRTAIDECSEDELSYL